MSARVISFEQTQMTRSKGMTVTYATISDNTISNADEPPTAAALAIVTKNQMSQMTALTQAETR